MNTLKAEKRSMSIKAKRLRREGYVTGNLFGKKVPNSIPIKMTKKDVVALLATEEKGSQIMLNVEGTEYDVLIKDIAFNPLKKEVDEIDFQALVSDEKVNTVAEIKFVNTGKITSGVFEIALSEIPYKALPAALVSEIKADVGAMHVNDVLRVKDLEIANHKDIDLMIDKEAVVASVRMVNNTVPDEEDDATAPTKETATSTEK